MFTDNMFIKSFVMLSALFLLGCTTSSRGNQGQFQAYVVSQNEPQWIRNGDPIKYEGELWYPQDGVETLLDSEVILTGDFQGIQFFVEKIDVRPFARLYTKFGKNKFRYYKKRTNE